MEKAEFAVDTRDWKTFYRMSYDGNKEKLWKFAFLVDGTIHLKLEKLNPELKEIAKKIAGEFRADVLKEIEKKVKAELKGVEVPRKLAEMWVLREVLSQLGLKTYPDLKQLKGILKEI